MTATLWRWRMMTIWGWLFVGYRRCHASNCPPPPPDGACRPAPGLQLGYTRLATLGYAYPASPPVSPLQAAAAGGTVSDALVFKISF